MQKGFTIIELAISIFILSVALVGIYNAFSIMVILASNSADRLAATYLAQEGMEIVRNMRDTNWLNMDAGTPSGAAWVDGFGINNSPDCSDNASASGGCKADYTTGEDANSYNLIPWSNSQADYLSTDPNGFYSYKPGGTQTKYKRRIFIMPVKDVDGKSDHIVKVIVAVSWDQKATLLNNGIPADSWISPDYSNCDTRNCVRVEETLYDWYNYSSSPPPNPQ